MDPSDAELMSRVQAGERQAFARLVDRHKDGLVAYLARLTGDRMLGEDLAQETFLRLYRCAASYTEQGRLNGFLYRLANRLAVSALRRRQRRRWLRGWFFDQPAAPEAADPERDLQRAELLDLLAEAIAALPLRYRIPLVLHEIEGLGLAAVARATGRRPGTVKSRIHRGRRLLAQRLEAHWQEGGAWMNDSSAT